MPRTTLSPRAASPRRWVLCAGLLAGGFVVGGGIGTLLVIGAVFAVLDAVIPIPRSPQAEAEDRFARLARSRRRRAPQLDLVDEGSAPLAAAPRPELGVQLIPIESITATTEPSEGAAVRPRLPPRPLDRGTLEVAVDGAGARAADVVELRTSRPTSSSPRRLTAR